MNVAVLASGRGSNFQAIVEHERSDIFHDVNIEVLIYNHPEANVARDDITGVLILMPLPSYIDKYKALEKLIPEKDVDGLTPYNKDILRSDYNLDTNLLPCTSVGIQELLD